jgi:hypothetical protein
MPLFNKHRTHADKLAKRRSRIAGGGDLNAPLLELLGDLDLAAEPLKDGWAVQLGPTQILLVGLPKEGVVTGMAPLGGMTAAEGMRGLLHANLEHKLGYFVGGDPDEIDGRIQIPADPFDREGIVRGLEGLAEVLEAIHDHDMSDVVARLREFRGRPDPDAARASATRTLRTSLGELELEFSEREEGIWAIETERGVVDAILADSGASWMLMHQLRYEDGDKNPQILRWLLDASGARGARLGMADLPDGPNLFSVMVLPAGALSTAGVAYGMEQVLRLGDEMDRQNGFA